jgi:16S rRNA (uracil1498-N3)-methyltransferase
MPHRYYQEGPLEQGVPINLSKEELKHLRSVMRAKDGEIIEVINGKGALATATFHETISVESISHHTLLTKKSIAIAITEPKNLAVVIEKGTELGITTFYLFPAKKSKLTELSVSKKLRFHNILISALKQSKRLFLPEIIYLKGKEALPKNQTYLLADFDGVPFTEVDKSCTFIIGPESGFTDKEILYFKTSLSAKGILLSDGVLRAETAAIAAATLM